MKVLDCPRVSRTSSDLNWTDQEAGDDVRRFDANVLYKYVYYNSFISSVTLNYGNGGSLSLHLLNPRPSTSPRCAALGCAAPSCHRLGQISGILTSCLERGAFGRGQHITERFTTGSHSPTLTDRFTLFDCAATRRRINDPRTYCMTALSPAPDLQPPSSSYRPPLDLQNTQSGILLEARRHTIL